MSPGALGAVLGGPGRSGRAVRSFRGSGDPPGLRPGGAPRSGAWRGQG